MTFVHFTTPPLDLVILSAAKNLTPRPFAEFILSEAEGLRVTILVCQSLVIWFNRLLKKLDSCFDRLSTNGKSPTILSLLPFAPSLSKGERRVFQHPARSHLPAFFSVAVWPFASPWTEVRADTRLLGKELCLDTVR